MRFEGFRGGTELRSVRLHGAQSDPLRARQRLERALDAVDWTPPHLPPRAVLLVRRLVVGSHSAKAFGAGVTKALRQRADAARRPWLHGDAATAEAVVFADEAELIACLIRDWLRGSVAERWWWQTIIGVAGAEQWLRRHVLPRGDALVPALSLLAPTQEVVPWVARLKAPDVRAAVTAVAHAFALPMSVTPRRMAVETIDEGGDEEAVPSSAGVDLDGSQVTAAVVRLMATVPEMRSASLHREQRRLLILALTATRALSWARTPEFARAIRVLDRHDFDAEALVRSSPVVRRDERPVPRVIERAPIEATPIAPIEHPGPPAGAVADPSSTIAVESPETERASSTAPEANRTRLAEPPLMPNAERDQVAETVRATIADESSPAIQARSSAEPVVEADVHSETDWWTALPQAETSVSPIPGTRVETQYGGIFYLLNAWTAMEIYADFTAPRGRNLAVSPWDLLALVGRAWFPKSFVADPIWTLLADLAVRDPEDEPGRDVDLPDGWFAAHLESLTARLESALGCEQEDVPTLVCRHRATIAITASALHVHLSLSDLPLDVRIAGLDRDPGWIPAAGRSVYFDFA
jgi:hypothetical protein